LGFRATGHRHTGERDQYETANDLHSGTSSALSMQQPFAKYQSGKRCRHTDLAGWCQAWHCTPACGLTSRAPTDSLDSIYWTRNFNIGEHLRSIGIAIAALVCCVSTLSAQAVVVDTVPASVVQRFVDAANARNLDGMMATVAQDAVFESLPVSGRGAVGRDSVRAQYSRVLARMPAGYLVSVASRITDGAFVTDLEIFTNADGTPAGRATWVYFVTGGKIQRAWVLRQPRAPGP
jgi:hypothetical protein